MSERQDGAVRSRGKDEVRKDGKLTYLKYPITGMDRTLTVATTRPETMLGDTAVAVHPSDKRYKDLVGKMIDLPLTGRQIPIVADEHVDPEFGTGVVKVTPAHDPNDYAIGQRHNLDQFLVMNDDGTMNAAAGVRYQGSIDSPHVSWSSRILQPWACWKRKKTTRSHCLFASGARPSSNPFCQSSGSSRWTRCATSRST